MRGSLLVLATSLLVVSARPSTSQEGDPREDVLEIPVETQLVRIDVVVTDRDGRPNAGLGREDFAILEDGQPQQITQFEVFERGRPREVSGDPEPPGPTLEAYRRRYIVLAIDDLHIDPGNLSQAKIAIRSFVERELRPEDAVAVVTTSGTSGLYQEFTSDAEEIRQALSRVGPRVVTGSWIGAPEISDYQAELIERGDPLALEMAVQEILDEEPFGADPEAAARRVLTRARMIREESSHFVRQTLGTLDGVMRSLTDLPGRKVLVLVSDGFLMGFGTANDQVFDLRSITDAGTRAGVVVYALDTRGLVATPPIGSASSVSAPSRMAPGLRERLNRDAENAVRDGMNGLAEGTGGFLVHSANDLVAGLDRILGDTETYYLLAYEPVNTRHDGRFRRIEVKLPGHRELEARTRRGYFAPDEKDAKAAARAGTEESGRRAADELRLALASLYPRTGIPVRLRTDFLSLGEAGSQIVVNGNVDLSAVRFRRVGERYQCALVVAGVVYDASGLPVADLEPRLANLSLTREDRERARREGLKYYEILALPPGSYEVRLAVRQEGGGKLGSASDRIELPDLEDGRLAMGGPFLLRAGAAAPEAPAQLSDVQALPRFRRSESLYYQLQVLNPALDASGATHLTIQTHVIEAGEPKASTPEQPLELSTRGTIPMAYTGRIGLAPLPPGDYELRVVVTDQLASVSVSRSIAFSVEG